MEGVVIKSTGSWLTVREGNGTIVNCKLKGIFRIKGIKTTNPVAVGDHVVFDMVEDTGTGIIKQILQRHNYIIRKAKKLSKVSHIIAANLDQAIVIVTLANPRTSTGFIDRFLVTTEAYHIPAGIVFNKIDLHNEKLNKQLNDLTKVYQDAGYKCISVSAIKGDNLELLKNALTGKITLLSGLSGVGKSALINAIEPGLDLKTKELSGYHKVGMHTTTFAEMLPLSFGGNIIDTPGIKEFGLTDLDRKKLAERFPEFRAYMHDCRFNNCTHVHEPDCAVLNALEHRKIDMNRYKSYLSIITDDYWEKDEKDYRLK